jgi:hypothetical protein
VIISVSLFVTISFGTRNVSKSVIRNFSTPDEERALTAAETVDYASIWTFKRFDGSSDPEAYIHPGTYLSYTWANFIDSEVIDYYQNRYDYQRKQIIMPRGVTFTYNANVTYLEQMHICNTTQLEQGTKFNHDTNQFEPITWYSRAIAFYGTDSSAPLIMVKPFQHMSYRNQSEYYTLSPEFDLNFSNCYLVEMELEYEEVYNPLAGFWVHARQIVVLDQNLQPVWIGINPSMRAVA